MNDVAPRPWRQIKTLSQLVYFYYNMQINKHLEKKEVFRL